MTRAVTGAAGTLLAAYGIFLLLTRQDVTQIAGAVVWLVAGVLVHDAVLAPLVLAAGWVGARLLPRPARAPAAVGFVVIGSVTLLAVPVLGRFGARSDNPTLLDRPYGAGWLLIAGLVTAAVVGASVVRSRHRAAPTDAAPDPEGD
ncbi:hypothetical protein [Nocardioides sp.]|uniref:hypothetical protein n=1 Tax=Nocardioides sp. TaxID=35761 RepID=UPI0027343A44|nr:hypothetical protein [Nocardioides sp.]MDP3891913.1 hypothetical protein [Nocardioides sp.]